MFVSVCYHSLSSFVIRIKFPNILSEFIDVDDIRDWWLFIGDRTLDPTKVVMNGCRVRIAWCGMVDALHPNGNDLTQVCLPYIISVWCGDILSKPWWSSG